MLISVMVISTTAIGKFMAIQTYRYTVKTQRHS